MTKHIKEGRRRKWSSKEERVLVEEWDIGRQERALDSQKCLQILKRHPDIYIFINSTKTDIQNKTRRIMKRNQKYFIFFKILTQVKKSRLPQAPEGPGFAGRTSPYVQLVFITCFCLFTAYNGL